MNDKNRLEGGDLEAFEQVLERYGSDRTRWPAPVRKRFASMVTENAEAKQRMREAEALDRLLDMAPPPAVDTAALANRIMAAVAAEAGPARATRPARGWVPEVARSRVATVGRTYGPAAALMAASLMLGMFSGLSETLNPTAEPVFAEASSSTDVDLNQIAFDGNTMSFFEEDFL